MSNVDAQELAKFSELAHKWWDTESEFRPLHQINPLRLAWIDELATLRGKRVLDVGCGGGILAEAMARKAAHVTGIDLAARPLGVARLHALEAGIENIDYREIATEALAQERPGAYDIVTCMEMLEHVPDPAAGGKRLRRAGQAGRLGVLLDAEPQRQGLPVRHHRCRVRALGCCPRARTSTRASSARASWRGMHVMRRCNCRPAAGWNTTL